jgi:isopenicillin N synthase-like dioxygenase
VSKIEIPVVFVKDFLGGGSGRDRFVQTVGDSLRDIGFFAVADHGLAPEALQLAYQSAAAFYDLPLETKLRYKPEKVAGQRGYTSLYTEHAKDSGAPDLKEFYQIGRVDVPDDHPVHQPYGPNLWPSEVPTFADSMIRLYKVLDALGSELLRACALYLGEEQDKLSNMTREGDTIVRVLFYPPLPESVPDGAIRAAAHEDINLITLLPGATASGLELLGRDEEWHSIEAAHDHIIVDAGDMLQNLTNGLFRSTTHRVVNPEDRTSKRYSMPCFIHPESHVDLTPLPSCIARTGGKARYPSLTAGEYLQQRLAEIGL